MHDYNVKYFELIDEHVSIAKNKIENFNTYIQEVNRYLMYCTKNNNTEGVLAEAIIGKDLISEISRLLSKDRRTIRKYSRRFI